MPGRYPTFVTTCCGGDGGGMLRTPVVTPG